MLKTVSSLSNAIGALNYKGTWNAATNNPTLTSGVGTKGDYYVVSVAGSTNLDGTTLWGVGDMAIFNGSTWQKADGGDTSLVTSLTVTGLTGYMYANNTTPVTASTTIPVANITGAVPNTVNVLAGTGLSGGGALTGNVTLNLANTSVVAATYGNATAVSQIVVDQQGRVTSASNVSISVGNSNLQNSNVVLGNTTLTLGSTVTAVGNLSLNNVTINSGNATLTNVNVTYRGTSSNTGALNVGGNLSSSDIGIISSFVGNGSTYSYVAIQNTNSSNTSYASVSTINDGFSAYSDLGTNSTTYSYSAAGFPNNAVSSPNASFLVAYSGDLALSTWSANSIHFVANSSASTTSAMVVNGNNSVTINSLSQTASSTAAMPTASLPLVPAGYLQFTLANATVVKIPYYGV